MSMRRIWKWGNWALALVLVGVVIGVLPSRAAEVRSYVAGNFFFQMDGVKAGWLQSADGGNVTAEVVNEAVGPNYFVKKHISTPKYEDITMQIGFSMSKAVYDWIAASWQMNYQRKNGAIIAADFKLAASSQREFFNALVTETTIPACDGAAKDPSFMTLKFAPEYTRFTKASGEIAAPPPENEQKMWIPSNFRLEIDGLDCTKVTKVDAFTVKQTAVTDDLGDARDYLKEPGKLEFPNLKITMPEAGSESWTQWHDDFLVRGNNGEDQEKGGRLVFLDADRTTELAEVRFHNMGIFALRTHPPDPGAPTEGAALSPAAAARVTAELYCERMELLYRGRSF